jgi:hypothetical protein
VQDAADDPTIVHPFRTRVNLWQQRHDDCVVGDAISGLFGGMLGGLAATPGAPVSIWCATKGWDKTRQRALYQPFILVMQIVALIAIPVMGAGSATQVGFPPMLYLYVPAGLIGTVIGFSWFRRMTSRQFGIAVNMLIAVSGGWSASVTWERATWCVQTPGADTSGLLWCSQRRQQCFPIRVGSCISRNEFDAGHNRTGGRRTRRCYCRRPSTGRAPITAAP